MTLPPPPDDYKGPSPRPKPPLPPPPDDEVIASQQPAYQPSKPQQPAYQPPEPQRPQGVTTPGASFPSHMAGFRLTEGEYVIAWAPPSQLGFQKFMMWTFVLIFVVFIITIPLAMKLSKQIRNLPLMRRFLTNRRAIVWGPEAAVFCWYEDLEDSWYQLKGDVVWASTVSRLRKKMVGAAPKQGARSQTLPFPMLKEKNQKLFLQILAHAQQARGPVAHFTPIQGPLA